MNNLSHGRWLAVAAAVGLLAACNRSPVASPAQSAAKAPYATVVAANQTVAAERRVDGRVEALNQGTVSAQTSGEVEQVLHDAGDSVPANGLVLRLRAVQQRAGLAQTDAAYRAAAARAAESETRYQRISDMYARQVVAKAAFDEITAVRASALAQRDAARAARDSAREGVAYTEVRMPFAGVITERLVRQGEAVAPGTPLLSVSALGGLRVVTDISQDLALIVLQRAAAFVYAGERRISARKVIVYPRAAVASAAYRVRVDLPDDVTGLLPGMFVKVGFVTGDETQILLPASSIIERGEVTGVYVFQPANKGRTVFRQVRIGHARDDRVEILAGVAAGEQVAIDPLAAFRASRP
jgi:RND family efflux transporter MFP subunit